MTEAEREKVRADVKRADELDWALPPLCHAPHVAANRATTRPGGGGSTVLRAHPVTWQGRRYGMVETAAALAAVRRLVVTLADHCRRLAEEVAAKDALVLAQAERIAAQSELLSKRAEAA